jgi:secernin
MFVCFFSGDFSALLMMRVLRDTRSGICMEGGGFASTGSQVSLIPKSGPAVHWFTATPNPRLSLYKPFVFTPSCSIGDKTTSPDFGEADPRKVVPRFQIAVDRSHPLWQEHGKLLRMVEEGKGDAIVQQMQEMEAHCVEDMKDLVKNFDEKASARVQDIFKHMVDLEMNFYK